MAFPNLESIKKIEHQYRTGEEPVLVTCSDMSTYVCKYMRSSTSAFKLACELIGAQMASAWQLKTPDTALVRIKQEHWTGIFVQHSISAPAFGSKLMNGVVDITPSTFNKVDATPSLLIQLLTIALFDFWIANEDRNANNANLLYDIVNANFVSIDYGCILNTATFEFSMSQLTMTDNILWSDLFHHIVEGQQRMAINYAYNDLHSKYVAFLKNSRMCVKKILNNIPKEWNVPNSIIEDKLMQLFDSKWTNGVWDNFIECLKGNIEDE